MCRDNGEAIASGQNQEIPPPPESSFRRFQGDEFNIEEKIASAGAQCLHRKQKNKNNKKIKLTKSTFAGQCNQGNRENKNASE